jgi:protein TonB
MDQPLHDFRPYAVGHAPTHRFVSVGLVVLLHVIAIYVLASGLAQNLLSKLPQEFKAEVIPPKQEVVKPPPPPPPDLQKPPPPFVPPPEINIQTETAPTNSITVQSKVATPPPPAPPAPPKPVGASAPVLVAARGADCISEYPAIALRLNQTGVTTVTVQVDAEGHPTNVAITNSSGHDSLDQAAIRCVQNHWHFKPAMQNGQAVSSTVERNIKWQVQ